MDVKCGTEAKCLEFALLCLYLNLYVKFSEKFPIGNPYIFIYEFHRVHWAR